MFIGVPLKCPFQRVKHPVSIARAMPPSQGGYQADPLDTTRSLTPEVGRADGDLGQATMTVGFQLEAAV